MSKKVQGICHICGVYGDLTYEHVPPKSAFNDKPIMWSNFEQFFDKGPNEKIYGKIHQKGSGGHTLCARCNNNTGSWYGNAFVDWAYQGMILRETTNVSAGIYYPFYIFPLRVIKQIITMFFSINSESFREAQPELVKFILNQEQKYLPPKINIYTYLMTGTSGRKSGVSSILRTDIGKGSRIIVLSEIAHPPLGYIMTFNSEPPDWRLVDITYFSRYGYNDWKPLHLQIPKLPVNMYFPADFRTKEEIMNDYQRNLLDMDEIQ